MSVQDVARPIHSGPRSRSRSYSDSTLACPMAQVPDPNSGDPGLPSILIGRPSRVLTRRLQAAGHAPQVVAYQLGTPGVSSSWLARSGIACSTGARPHALAATAAPSAPRNVRRLVSNAVSRLEP